MPRLVRMTKVKALGGKAVINTRHLISVVPISATQTRINMVGGHYLSIDRPLSEVLAILEAPPAEGEGNAMFD